VIVCDYVLVGINCYCFYGIVLPRVTLHVECKNRFLSTRVWFCVDVMCYVVWLMMLLSLIIISCGPVRVVEMSLAYFVDRGRIFDRHKVVAQLPTQVENAIVHDICSTREMRAEHP
jgi:hypothetical protein